MGSPKDRLKGGGERGIVLSPLLCHPLHYQPLLPHPVLTTPPPGGDPGLGLGPLDGGRLGIVWQPADSGQHSGLINCHPGSLLVQCELRRAVGWLQAHKFAASWTHELRGAFKRRTFQEENLSMKRSLDEIYPFNS